jgi:hypothetical protein
MSREAVPRRWPVLVENSAVAVDLMFHAGCWYSLMSPASLGRSWVRSVRPEKGRTSGSSFGAQGRAVTLVAASGVVVRNVLGEDRVQVALPGDQHPVSAFGADRAHEAFCVGVHPRGLRRGRQHAGSNRVEHGVEGGGEPRVPVPDQVGEPMTGLLELTGEVADKLGGPPARGVRRDPEQMHPPGPDLDHKCDIKALECDRAVDMKEVLSQQRGGVGAQEGTPGLVAVHWRRDAMSTQDLADGRGRDPVSEPTQLALDAYYSPAGFSRASRRINATSSSGIGGRPGDLGWRHFAAAMRRCQRSSVPGVTIRRARSGFGRTRASAASTARSLQDRLGLGVARRTTATSCRSASISASLDEEDRASNASQDTTVTSSR